MTEYIELAGARFEWDEEKAAQNEKKHGISFAAAAMALLDEHGAFFPIPRTRKMKPGWFFWAPAECGS